MKTSPNHHLDSEIVHNSMDESRKTHLPLKLKGTVHIKPVYRHKYTEDVGHELPNIAKEIPPAYHRDTSNPPDNRLINVLVELPNVKTKNPRV